MFNYIIFDLDNTIYNYDKAHDKSLLAILHKLSNDYNIENISEIFFEEKKKFQTLIGKTPASHNKYIQFKYFFEKNRISLSNIDEYFKIYEEEFNKNLEIYPGLINFLDLLKKNNVKLYILTNNLCREQINKLKNLNLIHYFDRIFTSEEFGYEKPDPKFFYYILNEINCKKEEVTMIGDNFFDDINSANYIGIYGFYFSKIFKINKNYLVFSNYHELFIFFNNYYNEINNLIKISDYIGERFDLVQAGGGNTSVKIDNIMYVKSSGINLTEMEINRNYVGIDYKFNIEKIDNENKKIREKQCADIITESISFLKNYKPSIETSIHSILKKYVVHFHPLQFNMISGLKNVNNILEKLFSEYCIVDYYTPGIDLAIAIQKIYKNEKIIFLKNHGVIFTVDNFDELQILIDDTMQKLENFLFLDFDKYKYVNIISKTMNKLFNSRFLTYLSNEKYENTIQKTFFPDKLIYCGKDVVLIGEDAEEDIKKYVEKYKEIPKIFIKDGNCYISSISLRKCREIEEVWRSHLMCISLEMEFLEEEELDYLNNWDAEKYRKMLK